jgi:transcriptional regulator with XRE-family HTH domain
MSAIGDFLTNDEVLVELGTRLRSRRLERNLTIDSVAMGTGLNRKTIIDAEGGGDVRMSTVIKILRQMSMLGVIEAAIPDTLPGAEAFSRRGLVRQRASGAPRRLRKDST